MPPEACGDGHSHLVGPDVTICLSGQTTPEEFVTRLEVAVAVLRGKCDAVEAGLIRREETTNYEWTTEAIPDGDQPVRVRAHLRAQKPGRPRVLHLEPTSLLMLTSRDADFAQPCLQCGRPALRGESYTVHLTPSGGRGPEGCRKASSLWPDGDDDELASRLRATCEGATGFRS